MPAVRTEVRSAAKVVLMEPSKSRSSEPSTETALEAAVRAVTGSRWPNTVVSGVLPLVSALADVGDDLAGLGPDAPPAKVRAAVNRSRVMKSYSRHRERFRSRDRPADDLRSLVRACPDVRRTSEFLRYLRVSCMWDELTSVPLRPDAAPKVFPEFAGWPSVGPLASVMEAVRARAQVSCDAAAQAVRHARCTVMKAMLDVAAVMGTRSAEEVHALVEALKTDAAAAEQAPRLLHAHIAYPSEQSAASLLECAASVYGPKSAVGRLGLEFWVLSEGYRSYGMDDYRISSGRRSSNAFTLDYDPHGTAVAMRVGCSVYAPDGSLFPEWVYSLVRCVFRPVAQTMESAARGPGLLTGGRIAMSLPPSRLSMNSDESQAALEDMTTTVSLIPPRVKAVVRELSMMLKPGRSRWV